MEIRFEIHLENQCENQIEDQLENHLDNQIGLLGAPHAASDQNSLSSLRASDICEASAPGGPSPNAPSDAPRKPNDGCGTGGIDVSADPEKMRLPSDFHILDKI